MSSSAALSASVSRALLDCPAAVTELLLTALSAAAAHGRLPFDKPSTLTATNQRGQQHSFLTNGNFDTGKLLTTVNAIPPLDALLQAATDYSLAATLDAIDPLILPLLDWTLHNHDVYIRQLTEEERLHRHPHRPAVRSVHARQRRTLHTSEEGAGGEQRSGRGGCSHVALPRVAVLQLALDPAAGTQEPQPHRVDGQSDHSTDQHCYMPLPTL